MKLLKALGLFPTEKPLVPEPIKDFDGLNNFDKLFEYHEEFYIDFNSEGVWYWYHGIHDMYQNVYIGALSTLDEVPGIKAM